MKKIIRWLVGIGIIVLIIFGIYKVFIDCEHKKAYYKRQFTLNVMDSATVEEETYVKLMKVSDERCKEDNCIADGQMVAKVLVVCDHSISYVTLGTLVDKNMDLEKIGINIELLEISESNEATFLVTRLKK